MKQKTTALLLVLAMVMSLFAGQQYQKTEVQAAQNNTEEVIINTGMPTTTVEPTAEPTAEPTEEPIAFPTEKPDEKPAAPVLTEAVTSEKGIYVRFSQVKKADEYLVYLRKADSTEQFRQVTSISSYRYEAAMEAGGVFLEIEEEVELGVSYEIMVRSKQKQIVWSDVEWWNYGEYVDVLSEDSNVLRADMPQKMVENVKVEATSQSETLIQWSAVTGVAGYEIQYAMEENGTYQTAVFLNGESVTSWKHTKLEIGTTYYYKVYAVGAVTKSYSATVVKCLVTFAKPKGVKGKMLGPTKMKLTWKSVEGASGYIVYCAATKNSWTEGTLKKYKTLKGSSRTSLIVPKVKNGICYHYRIMAYTVKNGATIEGNAAKYNRYADYYGYEYENYTSRWKRIYGGRKSEYNYRKSGKYMTTIRVKVWDFANGMSGRKVTKVKTLRIQKRIAPTMKKIFQEIYKGKEKAPIYEIGGYSARTGQHGQGLAIDINSNYNYMIDGRKVLAGSCWKPHKYAYSIKRNGDIEKAFRKYGFARGFWGDRKDYMHFSYFGT